MILLKRIANAIEDSLINLEENVEKTNDELSHGTLGRAWALTSITLGLIAASIGAIISILDSGGTHGPWILTLSGVMVIVGYYLLSTHEYRE